MQRCPSCDFVYEEDQRLCDMDGAELVHDPHELPESLVPRAAKSNRSIVRLGAFLIVPAVIVGGLLGYTSQQTASSSTDARTVTAEPSPVVTTSPAEAGAPSVKTEPPAITSEPNEENPARANRDQRNSDTNHPVEKTGSGTRNSPAPAQPEREEKKSQPAVQPTQPKPSAHQDSDSKLGSVLKKTARILKKPFKL